MPTASLTPIYDQLADEFTHHDDEPPNDPTDPEIRTHTEDE